MSTPSGVVLPPLPALTFNVVITPSLHCPRYIKQLMTEAGLTIREDPMGSIYGRLEGTKPAAGDETAANPHICVRSQPMACTVSEQPAHHPCLGTSLMRMPDAAEQGILK